MECIAAHGLQGVGWRNKVYVLDPACHQRMETWIFEAGNSMGDQDWVARDYRDLRVAVEHQVGYLIVMGTKDNLTLNIIPQFENNKCYYDVFSILRAGNMRDTSHFMYYNFSRET